jgi:hypothetical protein
MSRIRCRVAIVTVVWLAACAVGFGLLWQYKARPGDAGAAPSTWPGDVGSLVRDPDAPTLVMIAHADCPCTRASLGELNQVMQHAPRDTSAYVVMVEPETGTSDGELRRLAAAIPRLRVIDDRGGRLAARFGAAVSGHTLIYDADGALRFSGGITGARGHAGDNVGRVRVTTLLARGVADRASSNVFGCELEDLP